VYCVLEGLCAQTKNGSSADEVSLFGLGQKCPQLDSKEFWTK